MAEPTPRGNARSRERRPVVPSCRLAPFIGAVPGALVLRSDVIRKRQHGVPALTPLGSEAYSEAKTAEVYRAIVDGAQAALASGHSVIADAVHLTEAQRLEIANAARRSSVPFVGLWLDAPESVLMARVHARGPDASDAGVDVVRRQLALPSDAVTWHRLDASGARQQVCDAACAIAGRDLNWSPQRIRSPVHAQRRGP